MKCKVGWEGLAKSFVWMFKKLCGLMCTKEEIAGWFDVSESTIERRSREWCKELGIEDGTFDDLHKRYSAGSKMSVRRSQIRSAVNGNATMLIWFGKQFLGQKESPTEMTFTGDNPIRVSYNNEDIDKVAKGE